MIRTRALWPVVVALIAACAATGAPRVLRSTPTTDQILRTCVDRWNQGNMRDWGGYSAARVGFRPLDRARLLPLGLPFGPRRCVVSAGVDRSGSWSCATDRFGAYLCPLRHEPDRVPLGKPNARIDARGVLRLNRRLVGTHAPPRLAWQRYPRIDGFVNPWTRAGRLRAGLRFTSTWRGGGSCDSPAEEIVAPLSVRCVWRGLYQVHPCFVPPHWWTHRGAVVACPNGPGATRFARFVVGGRFYHADGVTAIRPWFAIAAIALGESRADVVREYDATGHRFHPQFAHDYGYYALYGGRVFVTYRDGRVNELETRSGYYLTWDGIGVGSRIPLGPCHRTARRSCEHRWRGFIWNAWVREKPCSCWVKVGDGTRSLPATGANFLKHWVFIYARHNRVTRIFMARKFVD